MTKKNTQILGSLSPKRDCGTKRFNPLRAAPTFFLGGGKLLVLSAGTIFPEVERVVSVSLLDCTTVVEIAHLELESDLGLHTVHY